MESDYIFKLPYPLQNILDDGYILWFANGRSLRDKSVQKTGQQFWLENGELHTHNVDPYHKKDLRTGWHAWRKLECELGRYEHQRFHFKIIGEDGWHMARDFAQSIKDSIRWSTCPKPPPGFSLYSFVEEMAPEIFITYHKRKQANTSAFRAHDAKAVVFQWLHKKYPSAVIVPEFGIGSDIWSKSSIVDLAAFDKNKIVFVEIKAETDSFVRVQKQLDASSNIANEVWLAIFKSKTIPDAIPLHVGIISFDKNGKIEIIKKPKILKQDKSWLGHIWTTELQKQFSDYKGAGAWIKNYRGGVDGLTQIASDILGKNARQFTINVWRKRHFEEYVWRRDLVLGGDVSVVSIARGNENNISESYFNQKYAQHTHLDEDRLKDLAVKEWAPPASKREKKMT